nr:uncharacterized protein LOC105878048 [Microcebus murinus]
MYKPASNLGCVQVKTNFESSALGDLTCTGISGSGVARSFLLRNCFTFLKHVHIPVQGTREVRRRLKSVCCTQLRPASQGGQPQSPLQHPACFFPHLRTTAFERGSPSLLQKTSSLRVLSLLRSPGIFFYSKGLELIPTGFGLLFSQPIGGSRCTAVPRRRAGRAPCSPGNPTNLNVWGGKRDPPPLSLPQLPGLGLATLGVWGLPCARGGQSPSVHQAVPANLASSINK